MNHRLLIQKIYNPTKNNTLCRVIQNLLSNRIFYKNGPRKHGLQAIGMFPPREGEQIVFITYPQKWGPDYKIIVQVGHATPLDGWNCSSQKRKMSSQIQDPQINSAQCGYMSCAPSRFTQENKYPSDVTKHHWVNLR